MKQLHAIYASVVMVIVLLPNLYAVVKGNENFPFTSCPMFAHYIGDDTQLYNFKFIGTYKNDEKILPPSFGHDGEIMSMRFFFSRVYGSTLASSPFTAASPDNAQLLEERLTNYFQNYVNLLPDTALTAGLETIRLEIWHYDENDEVADKHTVGYYALASDKFFHTWAAH